MGLYQSFQQVFVTNSPALLAQGKTVDSLAVGQIALLDGKTYKAVTTPTYAKNKALWAVWGTPNVNLGDYGSAPNENEYSKLIKGKLIKRFRSKAAQRAQTPLYTIGWSGDVADDSTLSARIGESKDLFIQLTGSIIDRMQDKTGLVRQFKTVPDCVDDCVDTCGKVNPVKMTLDLVDQINSDRFLKQYIRAKALISCDPAQTAPTTTTCYRFKLAVCDTGDGAALGQVQAQFPNDTVTRTNRAGAISTYTIIRNVNTTPAAFTSTGVFIPECPTCPTGFTLIAQAKVFQVRTPEGKTVSDVQAGFTGETSVTLISVDPQFNIFNVTFPPATTDDSVQASATAAGFVATKIGIQSNICQQTTPTTTTWASDGTLLKQSKDFRITLADNIPCGTDRLADLQAEFPTLVITVVDAAGDCVHTYETTVEGECYEEGCGIENLTFKAPDSFEGAQWEEVVPAPDPTAVCKTGILFETSFFHKETGECTYDAFPYENDVVQIQVSQYNPDFNGSPCEDEWKFRQIRGVKYPQGHGAYVRKMEEMSKMYDHRYRSTTPSLREIEGYSFQADSGKFYDEYVLEFDTKFFTAGGWSEQYTQSFSLIFFVPEGQGTALENTLNSYVSSAGIEEDGTAI